MKLRNKKTGEILEVVAHRAGDYRDKFDSLAELNEEWEDYEESKEYWYIDVDGEIMSKELGWFNQAQDDIGNRFETEEEAKQAVEKLKAWKRLKDKGFINEQVFSMNLNWCNPDDDDWKAFKLLFGGEE